MVGAARRPMLLALSVALLLSFCDHVAVRLHAQEVRATAVADTNVMLIGEQLHVTVSVTGPAGIVLGSVGPADSLEGLEIVRVDSAADRGGRSTTFTITAFDSGTYVVPPFSAYYRSPSDTGVRNVSTLPIAVFVRGVDVDTSGGIRAIKPPLDVPLTFMEVLPWALAVLASAALIWLVYYTMKKRKLGERFIPAPPPRPADELALEALTALASEKLWQRGKLKEYHTAVSEILRTYIENGFRMPAMESTSDEILRASRSAGFGESAVTLLAGILYRSDLVKFAKFVPEPSENEKSLEGAVSFVEQTRAVRKAGAERVPAAAPLQAEGTV